MLSERAYWVALVIGLTIFVVIDSLLIMPNAWDMGVNLFTDSIFMIITIIFLSLLFDLREKREWKNVKVLIMRRIGRYSFSLFCILARFIYPENFRARPSKEEVLRILRDLNGNQKATLSQYAYTNYFPKPQDALSLDQLETVFRLRKYLGNLESKYSRFMKPELLISIMEIQNCLDIIEEDFDLMRKFESSEEVAGEEIAKSILRIMKEIYKIHSMGIEIHPAQT